MILDSHIHVGDWDREEYIHLNTSLDEISKVLKESNISGAVITSSDRLDNQGLLKSVKNDKSGLFYFFFPWISPGKEEDLKFLEKNIAFIKGIKIHPSFQRTRINEKGYSNFLEFADRKKIAVLVHCGQWQEMASFHFAYNVAESFPNAKFIIAHTGAGYNAFLKKKCIEEFQKRRSDNVYLDTAETSMNDQISKVLEEGIKKIGAERFLFGSDFPICHPKVLISFIRNMNITDEDKDLILGGNLLRILK